MLQAAARLSFDFLEGIIKIDLTFCQFLYSQYVEFYVEACFSTITLIPLNKIYP
jgi:hypothetical protein